MSDQSQPNPDSLLEAALQIDSAEKRAAFLTESCGDNPALRQQVEHLLASHEQGGSVLHRPAAKLEATIVQDTLGACPAASPDARLAPASAPDKAVVIGSAGHSMLKSMMGQTIDLPRVVLREVANAGRDPIVRPNSPEMPDRNSESRYRLDGEVARGGMGAILKGRDTDLGRDLAIKVLLDQHKDKPEVIQRFIEEAQIGGQLQHPGIVPVYELGQFADKRPFFSMKLVKGETLSKLLADRKDASEDRGKFIGIFEQICQTMAYAHSRGVIHRDLKPANIMVGAFGEVQVMDWGLAKVLPVGGVADEKKARQTQPGQSFIQTLRSGVGSDVPGMFGSVGSQTQMGSVMGTPAYMPPEQALGEIDNLDERADVFGLGAILCEILTGQPPYVADDGTRVFRMASRGKLDDAFARLDVCGADEDLVNLTKHCLKPEQVDRPRDAGVLAERVAGYLESVETKLRNAEIERAAEAARANEEQKRRRTSLALAASVLLLVGLGSGGWLYLERQEANRQAAEADSQRKHAADMQALAEQRDDQRKAAQLAQRQADDEKIRSLSMLADMQTERGLQAAREGQAVTAALWFVNAAALTPHDLDRQRANHLRAASWMNASFAPAALLKLPDEFDRRSEFQTNGPLLLTLSGTTFRIWDWRNEMSLPWSEALADVTDAVWSPKGTQLAVGFGTADVRILDPMSGDELKKFQHSERVEVVEWSPDGTRLAVGGQRVAIWNVSGDPVQESDWPHPQKVVGVRFNRTGTRVVTACDDKLARVFAIDAESRPAPLFPPVAHAPSRHSRRCLPLFCDQDRKLATIRSVAALALWDAETGAMIKTGWPSQDSTLTSLAVGHDSRWLAASSMAECRLLSVEGNVVELKHPNQQDTISFSPDGTTLLTTCFDGIARLWPLSNTSLAVPAVGDPVQIPQLVTQAHGSFSADGSYCAISGRGQLVIWERPRNSFMDGRIDWAGNSWLPRTSHDGRLVTPGARTTFASAWPAQSIPLSVVHLVNGLPVGPAITLPAPLYDSCVCSDNRSVAAACDSGHAGTLTIYDIASGSTLVGPLNLPARPVCLDARPGHLQLATLCQDGTLQVFDSQSGTVTFRVEHDGWTIRWPHARVAYSPDGVTLVTVTPNGQVFVRDAETGTPRFAPLTPLIEGGPFRAIAFSPDSRLLATAVCGKNQVQVWDLFTGAKIGTAMPHPGDYFGLWSVDFSSDGKHLLTGHKDGRLRIWDWQTGRLVGAPMQNPDEVFDARFTPDGRYVVAAVKQSPLHIWDVATRKLAVATVSEIDASPGSRNCLSNVGDRVVVSASRRFTVLDLSSLLTAPSQDLPSLTRSLELATNQRNQLGELVSLDQTEWWSRWEQHVALRQTPEAAAELLAAELESASSESGQAAIVSRALRKNLGERLLALRPNDRWLLVTLALEWSRTGNEAALKRVLLPAIAAVEAELARRRTSETSQFPEGTLTNRSLATLTSDALQRQLVQLLTLNVPMPQWHTLAPTKMQAESACSFTLQSDGSIFAGAKPAATDRYTITSRSPLPRITALKLDAIPDVRLPSGGTGHNPGGNFHLTALKARVHRADGSTTLLVFRAASSDYFRPVDVHTKPSDGPSGAIDDDGTTRWDVFPMMMQPHWLTLQLSEPIEIAPTDELMVELDFKDRYADTRLGRFKLSVCDAERASERMLFSETIHRNLFAPHQSLAVLSLMHGEAAKALAQLADTERGGTAKHAAAERESVATPTHAVTWLLRAKAHQQLGETVAAKADVENMLASMITPLPRDLQGLFLEVAIEFSDRSRQELTEILSASADNLTRLNRVIELSPNVAANYGARGVYWTRLGRWREAAADFERERQLNPKDRLAWISVACALLLAEDKLAYQTHCQSMLKYFHEDRRLPINTAICRVALLIPDVVERSQLPVQLLRDSLTDSSPDAVGLRYWTYSHLAFAAYRDGKYEDALALAKQPSIQTGSIGAQLLLTRAMAEEKLGRHEDAVKTLAQAEVSIPPELRTLGTSDWHGPLPVAEAIVFRDHLLNEIVRREASLLIHQNERRLPDVKTLRDQGLKHFNAGKFDEALPMFRRAIDIDPNHGATHHMLGQCYLRKNQLAEARTAFETAIKVDPDHAPSLLVLGLFRYGDSRLDEARTLVERSIALAPTSGTAHRLLGLIRFRQGDLEDAINSLNKALELNPQDSEAAEALASTKRLLPLAGKLEAFLDGSQEPADNTQRQELAELCHYRKKYVAAVRLLKDAFEKKPMLTDDPMKGLRYNAACAAARAGNGEGDAAKVVEAERSQYRRQAADWLRAELDSIRTRLADAKPIELDALLNTLDHWREDPDLASLRDVDQVQKLPADEQTKLKQLWSDVEHLLTELRAKQ